MSAPTPHRYFNISSCTIGGTAQFNTIKSISYTQDFTHLASAGDADGAVSFMARGAESVSVTIEMEDGVQAEAILGTAVGNLVFIGQTSNGGSTKTVTIKNFQAFSHTGNDAFNAIAKERVSGHGYDPTGTGPIVTVTSP